MLERSKFDLPIGRFKEGVSIVASNGFKAVSQRWREALIATTALTTACANENTFFHTLSLLPREQQVFYTGFALGCIFIAGVLLYSVLDDKRGQ